MTDGQLIANKSIFRWRQLAKQALALVTSIAMVLASSSGPAVAQSFGGASGGSSGSGFGGMLDGLKLPGQSSEPEAVPPAPSATQSAEPEDKPADGAKSEAEPDEPPLLLTPGAAHVPEMGERERELLAEALTAEANTLLAARSHEETPSSIAARIGSNSEVLAAWVRENTSLIPYRGILKGAGGVLRDREGNSLERAALLAEMLAHHGIEARLVRYILDDAQARSLLPLADRGAPNSAPAEPGWDAEAVIQRAAVRAGIDLAVAQQAVAELEAHLRNAAAGPKEIFDRAEPILMTAAHDARLSSAARLAAAERTRMVAALSDHFSVEIRDGGGWSRLPLVTIKGELQETEVITPKALLSRRDLRHLIRLSVKIAFDYSGRSEELVSVLFSASGFDGVPVSVSLLPIEPSDAASITGGLLTPLDMASVTASKMFERAQAGDAPGKAPSIWLPVISYGADGAKADRAVDLSGELLEGENLRRRSNAMGAAVEDMGRDLLGIAQGGNRAEDKARGFKASMIWLEIETTSPAGDVRLSRRLIARVPQGATGEETGALIAQIARVRDLQISTGRPTGDWLGHNAAQAMAGLASVDAADVESLSRAALPNPLVALFRANRWHAIHDTSQLFLESPNIVLIESRLEPEGGLTVIFDVVENTVAVRPKVADHAYELRVRQGLADTVAEALFAGPEPERVISANAALALAARANDTAAALRPISPALTAFLQWTEGMPETDTLTVLAADSGALHHNWRLNPQTGQVIGGDAMGRGSVYTDYISRSSLVLVCTAGAAYTTYDGFNAWQKGNHNKAAVYAGAAVILAGCAVFGGISIYLLYASGAVALAAVAGMLEASGQWAALGGFLAAGGAIATTGAGKISDPDPAPPASDPVPDLAAEDPGDLDLPERLPGN